MTEIRQPGFVDIWPDLTDEAKATIFPLLKGEDREAIIAVARSIQDVEDREELLKAKAVEALFWDDVKIEKERLKRERSGAASSWDEEDVEQFFDTEQERPTVGEFLDGDMSNGGGIFYAAKVNEIHGPSESGKTMVLLAVAAQEIRAGNHVVMVDFEDGGRSIVNRLRWVFGLDKEEILKQFHYFRPETAFDELAFDKVSAVDGVTFCIVDAVTEAMSLAALSGRDEGEVATWYNQFPKRLARLGWAVAVVDHTGQENLLRAIGSQHKKSGVDGVSYTAEPISQMVKGRRGQLRLKIAKDKPGGIRDHALPQGEGKQFHRGDFIIDGRNDPQHPTVTMRGVDPAAFQIPVPGETGKSVKEVHAVLPSPRQAVVLEILAETTEWMTASAIADWHNKQFPEKKDPRRLDRTDPRKMAQGLIKKGLTERRESGDSVLYRITPDGHHSINAWSNAKAKDPQMALDEDDGEGGS